MNFIFLCDYLHPTYGYQEFHLAEALAKKKEFKNVIIFTSDRYFPFKNYKFHKNVLGQRIHNKIKEEINGVKVFYYKPFVEKSTRLIPGINFFNLLIQQKINYCFSHSSTSVNSIILLILSRLLPFKIMVDCHMHYSAKQKNFLNQIFYFFIKIINKYIASSRIIYFGVTKESCEFLQKEEGVNKRQIKLLPIGFVNRFFYVPKEINEYIHKYNSVRDQLGISKNEILILQTGKLSKDKRPDLTIEASTSKLKNKTGTILFIGPHSESEKLWLQELFKNKANKNWKISFIKNVQASELNSFFIAADLLSYPGGATLSCIEGAASGCRSVVANSPEGLSRSNLGFVSTPNNSLDKAYKILINLEINKIDLTKVNFKERFKNSKKQALIVKKMSYLEVSKVLIKACKSM